MELLALLLITTLIFAAGLTLQRPWRRRPPAWPQRAPFLGGGLPDSHAWSRYHLRYYPMTLLLIAFEMEMMFMYPWAGSGGNRGQDTPDNRGTS